MALGTGYSAQNCSIARALEIVGERWTVLVLRDCFYGVRRFSDLLAHLDISRAVLTDRLSSLVEAGLLVRHAEGGHPEYVLTEAGIAFWPSIFALGRWGDRFGTANPPSRIYTHADCRGDLDDRGVCLSCGAFPGPEDIDASPGPGADNRRTDAVSAALRQRHRLLTPVMSG
ncbi:HxlR family transcriptional regulator [Antricoccus suffuscus]|uniref:HxlR family transcriptional regulator n=1 Tax=Antricoccus suffuscus TaxID=1629062 RepID=A0A2T0ZW38_9ACTN|nr:helix-turn-helix domain-containing protein [Antricoccus suffuscus]PRZ40504.1 HxlR family transcriptional regulator [Antricoccus suffuscus]